MSNRITREVVEAFLLCKTKGTLRHSGQRGITSDHEALLAGNRNRTRQAALHRLLARVDTGEVVRDVPLTADLLRRGPPLILDATLEDGRFALRLARATSLRPSPMSSTGPREKACLRS